MSEVLTRDRMTRALTEEMTIRPVEGGDGAWVEGENGSSYWASLATRSCSCPDHKFRGTSCKHLLKVAAEEGIILGGE